MKYDNAYKLKHYKRMTLFIPLEEKEAIEKLQNVKAKNAYIVNLINEDIKKNKKI